MEPLNKICVVAGGTGALGVAITRRLHAEGAHLAVTYRQVKPESLCGAFSHQPVRTECYQLDVTDCKQVKTVIEQIRTDFGRIDVLVNCTGIQGPIGALETLDTLAWAQTIETNLLGSVYLAQAVLPGMKERGGGKIILFSGGGAAYGRPYFTAYSSSKAAVVRFAESLALEVEVNNIQVNTVAPGPFKSRMWDEMRAAGQAGGPKLEEELKRMEETGGVSPDRAAGLVSFLASGRSNRLTGRLLSAVWDDWEHWENGMEKIAATEAFTLRRVGLK
jgi:NAD(P)-dependent dehydrogenase (short-subunit alcohol dehydrogenase family)